jgi:hypothetical protein
MPTTVLKLPKKVENHFRREIKEAARRGRSARKGKWLRRLVDNFVYDNKTKYKSLCKTLAGSGGTKLLRSKFQKLLDKKVRRAEDFR